MLHKNVIETNCGFRDLNEAEMEAVSGGGDIIVTGTRDIIVTGTRKDDGWVSVSAEDMMYMYPELFGLADSVSGGLWLGEGGSHGGENYQGHIVVTPGEIQKLKIYGKDAYVVLNHEEGTFVEYAIGDVNKFGFPINFYPVGTGTFTSQSTTAWEISLPFVSIPINKPEYVLERDPD
jgi:hypothetical protein